MHTCRHRSALSCTTLYIWLYTKQKLTTKVHVLSGLQCRVKPSRWRWNRNCWKASLYFIRTDLSRSPWPWSVKGREGSRARDRRTSLSQYEHSHCIARHVFRYHCKALCHKLLICLFVVWVRPETGGCADADNLTAQGHQETSKRCHGSSSSKPRPGCCSHRELYHVSRDWICIWWAKVLFFVNVCVLFLCTGLWWTCTRQRNPLQYIMLACLPSTRWSPLCVKTRCDILQHASISPRVWRY